MFHLQGYRTSAEAEMGINSSNPGRELAIKFFQAFNDMLSAMREGGYSNIRLMDATNVTVAFCEWERPTIQ